MILSIIALIGMAEASAMTVEPDTRNLVENAAAFLFAYDVKDQAKFSKGYKSHLQWHASAGDKLCWYGWTVASGKNVGRFIDGAFGSSLKEYDQRPDPAGDGADFSKSVLDHVRPAWFSTYQLLPDPSTDFSLEDHQPGAYIDAYYVDVSPANADSFYDLLSQLSSGSGKSRRKITWYRAAIGGPLTRYLALAHRDNWSELSGFEGMDGVFGRREDADQRDLRNKLANHVVQIETEIWRYLPDLSLCPE